MNPRKMRIATPTGQMTLVAHDRALLALVWDESELERLGLAHAEPGANGPLEAGARQLEEYFRGKRTGFELPLDPVGTGFQRAVWSQLERIPFGSTWSYRELALRVGNPGAVRAVGTANGRNPLCILIPCHRVVRATGEPGGYAGGLERKIFLLGMEEAAARDAGLPASVAGS
jgi:methylated-DNA-[protein]-cysteine S-methyltransferase